MTSPAAMRFTTDSSSRWMRGGSAILLSQGCILPCSPAGRLQDSSGFAKRLSMMCIHCAVAIGASCYTLPLDEHKECLAQQLHCL